ncbi:LPXTG cell wall anchor domain-containing protein [Jeotgalicoccus halotolerans]
MIESLNLLMMNNAASPSINWIMVLAGVLLLGLSLFIFLKQKK